MKTIMLIVGAVAAAFGVLWALQGANIVQWPAGPNTMVGDMHWVYYGIATAVIGIGLVWYSRR